MSSFVAFLMPSSTSGKSVIYVFSALVACDLRASFRVPWNLSILPLHCG